MAHTNLLVGTTNNKKCEHFSWEMTISSGK